MPRARMTRRLVGTVGPAAGALGWFMVAGCNTPPAVNPWRDDSLTRASYSSPSSEGILAAGRPPSVRVRDFDEMAGPHVAGDVPHYPLWWEDPLEDKGDQDRVVAWTWQDYVGMPYSFGRFLLNTMAWPVSAVVTPPGTAMLSDSVVGRDHDARPGASPNPTAGPEDFGFSAAEQDFPAEDQPSGPVETY